MVKIIIASTGASGAHLAFRAIEFLPREYEAHLILTDGAKEVVKNELKTKVYCDLNLAAPVASGSFGADMMMIIPCSMNTLAKIACGIADNLTTRAASVMIKEQKRLLIAPREMPFSPIALENMLKLSRLGVIISPPIIGYYSLAGSIDEIERFIIGKWFDALGIKNSLYKRWGEDE